MANCPSPQSLFFFI
jgi:lactate/malate dehydrogenase, alpha/beta C-terminal domain